jgi:Anti-sigma factor NepR
METAETRNRKDGSRPAKLSREVQARLGQQLRSLYDDVVNQGVPDRFTDLINRINVPGNQDGQ